MWIEECCVVTSTFSDLQKVNHKPRYKAFSKVFLVVCSVPGCVQDYNDIFNYKFIIHLHYV